MQARSDAEPIRYDVEPLVTVRVVQMGELEGTRTALSGGQVELMLLPVYEGGA